MNTENKFRYNKIHTNELVEVAGGVTYPPFKYENFFNWLISLLSHDGII